MNRNATLANKCRRHRELILWLPLGLVSLFYLLTSPNYSPSNETNNSTSSASIHSVGVVSNNSNSTTTTETTTTSSPVEVQLHYKLEINTTITNSNGDRCNVLRYSAHERSNVGDDEDSIFHPISTLRWAQLLSNRDNSKGWIRAFTNLLADAPMNAFFFETQGVTIATSQHTPFEFVLVESSYLYQFADAEQDPDTFQNRFRECNNNNNNKSSSQEDEMNGCVFSSLGGDSMLIAPMQMESVDDNSRTTNTNTNTNTNTYGHFAAFVRRAPSEQVLQFWKLVMRTFVARLESEDPNRVWLSTDGTGVAWLHVRLDPMPKYYHYMPYVIGDED